MSLPFGNGGQPWPIPGVVEAEDFDLGGDGVAYYDVDPNNRGDVVSGFMALPSFDNHVLL